ncbi:MAG: hypothetical protein JST82_15265 [Bacteroidetes bacterium]|nr:hypothetical protein [Bacteroidota bacterium]
MASGVERHNGHKHQNTIHISPSFRWVENAHILLWLIKDTCWAMVWKPGGIIMIFPTLSVALYILWKSRKIKAELYHNIAVVFWISANSLWMIGEFIEWELRPYAVVLFGCGLFTLAIYYAFFFRKDKRTYNMN